MKTGKFAVALVAGAVLSGSASVAFAQTGYAGISLGQAEVKDFCDNITFSCDDTAGTGRIYAGAFFDQYLAFEGGYRYIDDVTMSDATASLDVSYHMFDSSLVIYTPRLGPAQLFVKAGAQFWQQDLSLSGGFSEKERGVAFRTGAGATIDITERFAVRLEWDYLQNVGDDAFDNLKSDIHVFSAGPEFRF